MKQHGAELNGMPLSGELGHVDSHCTVDLHEWVLRLQKVWTRLSKDSGYCGLE